MISGVLKRMRRTTDLLENEVNYFRFMHNKEQRSIMANNEIFRNKHLGERCFVIGNGPSLRQQNLSGLNNEIVFTVNDLSRSEIYEKINPNYHFVADPVCFQLDTEGNSNKQILDYFFCTRGNPPMFFVPFLAKQYVERTGLNHKLQLHYFFNDFNFIEGFHKEIDFTKCIPNFYTVVHYAIAGAIFMGFSTIYILGCDMTGYREVEKRMLNIQGEDTHCFSSRPDLGIRPAVIERSFYGFYEMFAGYRKLGEYCKNHNIRLINVTEGGMIDSLERQKLEAVL